MSIAPLYLLGQNLSLWIPIVFCFSSTMENVNVPLIIFYKEAHTLEGTRISTALEVHYHITAIQDALIISTIRFS